MIKQAMRERHLLGSNSPGSHKVKYICDIFVCSARKKHVNKGDLKILPVVALVAPELFTVY